MLLQSLEIHDFRCFSNTNPIPIHKLTVFIGENDAGKTAVIEAIQFLLTNKVPDSKDYRQLDEISTADSICIRGVFRIEEHDKVPYDYCAKEGKEFILTRVFEPGRPRTTVVGLRYKDNRWDRFSRLSANEQKELLSEMGIDPGSNAEQRIRQYEELVTGGAIEKVQAEIELQFSEITQYLPKFELIASADYRHPDRMVQRTFQAVVDGFLRPENPESGERELRSDLVGLKTEITEALNQEVEEIKGILRRTHPRLQRIEVSPEIDFSRSVTAANLMVDLGEGLRLVDAFGEGTKKKLWMGLIDWQSQTQQDLQDISIIRVYDEPDVNLDYAAEQKLFSSILESTRSPQSRTQAIVCTHAITLIDRAPGKSINLIQVKEDGSREIRYLESDTDEEVEEYLSTIGRSVGLSNSALFYEKAFLVVEGESEENALPILYRHLYQRSMIEDGIVLIPLFTCSAWKPILSVLNRHKYEVTVMLLDQDCLSQTSTARITADAIREIGYPSDYLDTSCFFIGNKEFEDAFHSQDIAAVLNLHWPKEGGKAWEQQEIDAFRDPDCKFAEDLLGSVKSQCKRKLRNTVRKPEFATRLAEYCKEPEQIPEMIRTVFQALRTRAGHENQPVASN